MKSACVGVVSIPSVMFTYWNRWQCRNQGCTTYKNRWSSRF